MGIGGFAIGALIAILIRLAQGLDPNPDHPFAYVGPAMVLGAFLSTFFFVWGMGAFNPAMNVHGEHAAEEHEPEPDKPISILGAYAWRITFALIIGLLAIWAFATLPGGPALRSVKQADGNAAAVGMTQMPLPFGGPTITVSYLVLFMIFVAWTIISLVIVAAAISFILSYLSRGAKNPQATPFPWRGLGYVLLLIGPLVTFLVLFPKNNLGLPLIAPIFVIPPLLFLIAYRHPVFLIWLLPMLALPGLVPSIDVPGLPNIVMGIVGAAALAVGAHILSLILPERLWKPISPLVYGVILVVVVVGSMASVFSDTLQTPPLNAFLALLFDLTALLLAVGFVLPVWFLKMVIPRGIWTRFAAIRWNNVIPDFAGWLAKVLRGIPAFIGQR
jgi:hypothetical protein